MGLQKIVVLCAIALALGASGWYFMQNNRDNDGAIKEAGQANERVRIEDPDSFTGFGTIAELMEMGADYECDFRVEHETGISEGSVYVDGGGGRYSMHGRYEQADTAGSFGSITDGAMMYWWGETPEGEQGMRFTLSGDGEVSGGAPGQFNQGGAVAADESVAYDCRLWGVDESVFVPPSDVEFTDMDEMMDAMYENAPEDMNIPPEMREMMQ